MFGPNILSLSPTLCEDFWKFDAGIPSLARGYPRWIIPATYQARDKCLASVKRWHNFVRQNFKSMTSRPERDYDPSSGAEIMRFRRNMYSKMEAMDADAEASEDLGLMWG